MSFCWDRGHIEKSISSGNFGPESSFKQPPLDDILWPSDSIFIHIPSLPAFYWPWQTRLPNVKIQPPSKDTCNKCHLLKLHVTDDRVNENIKSFQEDDKSESDSDSDAETT